MQCGPGPVVTGAGVKGDGSKFGVVSDNCIATGMSVQGEFYYLYISCSFIHRDIYIGIILYFEAFIILYRKLYKHCPS